MSKTTIKTAGDAYVLTSGIKFSDIQDIVKYGKSSALKLIDKETKNEYFAIGIGSKANVNKAGVEFTGANSEGMAEATFNFEEISLSKANKEIYLTDKFAGILTNLDAVQKQVEAAIKDVNTAKTAVKEALTIN